LKLATEVMDSIGPIHPQDIALSGDVVEEQRLGQRNDTLAWFWCIGTMNDEQGNEWMDELSDESGSCLVLFHKTFLSLQGQLVEGQGKDG